MDETSQSSCSEESSDTDEDLNIQVPHALDAHLHATLGQHDAPGTSTDVELQGTSNLHIGDTNIHTTGPVYNITVVPQQEEHLETLVQKKCAELKSALKERVRSIATEASSLAHFTQRPITPVNLSVVSKPQRIEDEFIEESLNHCREEMANVYERPPSDITADQLFDSAKQAAQKEADAIYSSKHNRAKQEYIETHGNIVGVVGQPGIGKTTLSKNWALQALSRQLFGNISFFFYIAVRFIDFNTKMTFLQFLLHTILPDWYHTPDIANGILEAIKTCPNVHLIFDGLDEAAFKSFSSQVPIPCLHSKNKPEVYLKSLLAGKLLPHSRKIFTSRPGPFYKLHPSHRPTFIVQVLGLTPRSQEELGRQICGSRYEVVKERLEQNSALFAYCYVPVNFILTVHYLMSYDGDIQFVSLSQILAFTCVQYAQTDHLKGQNCELNKLAKMAWNGVLNKRVVFDLKDFKNARISDTTADAFLNISVTKKGNFKLTILDGHKRKYFSHLIWQEFFAAVYLMMIIPLKEFKIQFHRLSKQRFKVVAKFAFGICSCSVFNDIELVVPECSRDDWVAKKQLLASFASSCTKKHNNAAILQGCSWAHEANDGEITSSVSGSLPTKIDLRKPFSHLSLPPSDLQSICYVLAADRPTPLRILNMFRNNVGDLGAVAVSRCIHNIEDVDLSVCNITCYGVGELCGKIRCLTKPLKKLELRGNKFGDAAAKLIGQCIFNIEEIGLSGVGLGLGGVDELSKKIQALSRPLKRLDLSRNLIGDAGIHSICRCIQNIERLVLYGCDITRHGAEVLFTKIKLLKAPMEYLNLSGTNLTDKSAASLAACVHNVKQLVVEKCDFTGAGKKLVRSESRGEVKF